MKFEDFVGLGFNKNEAIVYVSLIKYGSSDARQIIRDTKFHKNIVYDNLEKLMEKGLVSFITQEGRKVYKTEPADMLISFLESQEKEANNKVENAKAIAKQIEKTMHKDFEAQEATMYKGMQGLKLALKEVLYSGTDYVSFGAPLKSFTMMGEAYWKNYNLKQKELSVHGKLLFNESLRIAGDYMPTDINEVRFFDRKMEPMTQTIVYGDKTMIIVWSENPVVTLIRDKHLAQSYSNFFKMLWSEAKR